MKASYVHPNWKKYEFQVCQYHREKYKHIVWHVDRIPEEEMENAFLIHNYNEHRLYRIRNKRLEDGKSILYSDYGIDALTKDPVTNKYHGLQAKCYTKKKVKWMDRQISNYKTNNDCMKKDKFKEMWEEFCKIYVDYI
jgi:hypothetical protein